VRRIVKVYLHDLRTERMEAVLTSGFPHFHPASRAYRRNTIDCTFFLRFFQEKLLDGECHVGASGAGVVVDSNQLAREILHFSNTALLGCAA